MEKFDWDVTRLRRHVKDLETELEASKKLLRDAELLADLSSRSSTISREVEKLKSLSVLIIGAGGLGCPTALYLAAAGVGKIGVVDDDAVDISNLHRQVAHPERHNGLPKAESLCAALRAINSVGVYEPFVHRLSAVNVEGTFATYDVIVDCTDNPGTRFLINDACVLMHKPLVSGAALTTDGQLSVYNFANGPCYRCMHAAPPETSTVQSCSDAGVLGPVAGVIGCLQALEVLKIAASTAYDKDVDPKCEPPFGQPLAGKLLIFDGAEARFRVVKLRGRSTECAVCGDSPVIKTLLDSEGWLRTHQVVGVEGATCGAKSTPAAVPSVTVAELQSAREANPRTLVIDVRPVTQFRICSLRGSVNIPLANLERNCTSAMPDGCKMEPLFVVCRRGVDSVAATALLRDAGWNAFNVKGGLQVLPSTGEPFPTY